MPQLGNSDLGYHAQLLLANVTNFNMPGGAALTVGDVTPITTATVTTLTGTGLVTLSRTANVALSVTGAPVNTATLSLVRLGGAIAAGNTAANGGTYLGINAPAAGAGSAADFANWQANGTSQFKVANAGNVTAAGTLDVGGGTTGVIQYKAVSLTSANILGMFAAAVELIAAPGANKTIIPSRVLFRMTRTATAYANGGAVTIGYNAATVQALDSTIASTVITGAAATTDTLRNGAVISDSTALVNQNIAITNATGAFITGTGTAVVSIWYGVV